jgi:uncharacterized membrane protein
MVTTSNNSGDYTNTKTISKKENKVSYKRHIAKTISYRVISTTIGIVVVWGISGSFKIGTAFGVAELVYKPIQYYIHERVWYKWIKYGLTNNKK